MQLHTLLKLYAQHTSSVSLSGIKDIEIKGVREDSRQVRQGDLFIARGGAKTDGRQFAVDALSRGAAAILSDMPIPACPLPQVKVSDLAAAASILANCFHEQPSRTVQVMGVTGTNGKTTTTYLLRHILASVKRRCGMIGTVEIDDGRSRREATMTTPSATEIAELLATMRDKGCWSCAMEVSSHALDQGRVAGVQFAGAAFTNLTGDHLDYHATMDRYAAAKARLFASLDASAVAVVNASDTYSPRMLQDCKARVIQWGLGRKGDYRARDISVTMDGSTFTLITPDGEAQVQTHLIGRHNIANALTAAALAGEVFHLSVQQIADSLRDAAGAPGRLQPVRCGQPFGVFVDYAHTDDGLENVLGALRPLARNRLRVIFGCGGDRDRTKRPRMARVAERLADVLYITSDNPRTENPDSILAETVAGLSADVQILGASASLSPRGRRISGTARVATVEADRRVAIERALHDAEPGDIVLIAGKGHENYQIIGTEKRHFDDVEEATRVLRGGASAAAA